MTTPNVPSIWSGGAEWGPAETAGASGYWLADDWNIGLTGRPHVFVAIAGKLVNGFGDDSVSLQSGSWELGRRDWFDVLTSSTGSFTFFGSVEAASGDEIVVSTESGVLWVGNVNGVTETQNTDGSFTTQVSAVDAIGRLGQTVPPNGAVTNGTDTWEILFTGLNAASYGTEDVIRYFLDTFGAADVALAVGDSSGTLPTLTDWYEPPELTLLDVLNTIERTANAMMTLQPDGSLLITMRDAIVDPTITINGEFETNTTGWTDYNGATISRSSSSPYSGTWCARITAAATAYSGDHLDVAFDFIAGRSYRLTFAAQLISGTGDWYAEFYDLTYGGGALASTTFTADGTWQLFTLDWTPTRDHASVELGIYHPAATAAVLAVDAVTLTGAVQVIDLVGVDAPYQWTIARSGVNVINHWVLERPQYHHTTVLDEPSTGTPNATLTDSIALYGDRAYQVGDYLCTSSSHFSSGLKEAMAAERPVLTAGRFHVTDLSQRVLLLSPLSWVRQGDDTWQVMSVHHEFSGNTWDVTITADVSQNAMVGTADPDPVDPAGTTTTHTQTLTSTKSAVVVKSSGGSFMGNGAGDYLPCGYYDGFRHRPLIDFTTLSWPAGFVRVKKATLILRTTGQSWVTFGSKPKFYAKRITSSWSEGTFNAAAPSQYSSGNASVWPGPNKTNAGQALKTIGTSENNDISVDVTDILQAAHDAGDFRGIMLVSANEDSHTNTTEFYSDDHATSGFRPELVVICEVS